MTSGLRVRDRFMSDDLAIVVDWLPDRRAVVLVDRPFLRLAYWNIEAMTVCDYPMPAWAVTRYESLTAALSRSWVAA